MAENGTLSSNWAWLSSAYLPLLADLAAATLAERGDAKDVLSIILESSSASNLAEEHPLHFTTLVQYLQRKPELCVQKVHLLRQARSVQLNLLLHEYTSSRPPPRATVTSTHGQSTLGPLPTSASTDPGVTTDMAESVDTAVAGPSTVQKTTAQILQEQHDAAEKHTVTVEDVPDEEDLKRHSSETGLTSVLDDINPPATNGTMSAKAAGKQRATQAPAMTEEHFPALGGGPKPQSTSSAPLWGSKGKADITSNGIQNSTLKPTPVSVNATTPFGKAPLIANLPGAYERDRLILNRDINASKVSVPKLISQIEKSGVRISTQETSDGIHMGTNFHAVGQPAAVEAALRRISKELTPSSTETIQIPASLRSHIIGKGGSTIAAIQTASGASVKVQKDSTPVGPSTGFETAVVEITGDPTSRAFARSEIEKIVKSRPVNANLRMNNIPPEFFPFIESHPTTIKARQQNPDLVVDVPPYYQWSQQRPPQVSSRSELPQFAAHPDKHIKISGEQAAAVQAKADIEKLVKELEQQLRMEDQSYQRSQHQFIVGDRGMSPEDFLAKTGCIVVLPDDAIDTEDVIIIGPEDRLNDGIAEAERLAAEMLSTSVDPFAHIKGSDDASSHARALALYLQEREIAEELARNYNAQISFPTGSATNARWDIFSRDQMALNKARGDVTKIVQAHPPDKVKRMPVDAYFHPHVRKQHKKSMRENLGVHMIVDDDAIFLIYEGKPESNTEFQLPRQRPSQAELAEFEAALQEAQNQIAGDGFPQVAERTIPLPKKFHDKVGKFGRQSQAGAQYPVDLQFELLMNELTQEGAAEQARQHGVRARGPADGLDAFMKQLEAFIKQAEEDEKERGHITSFDFPEKYVSQLVGRQGGNINALREKYDVEIDTQKDKGKVHIKGPKKNATACQAEIMKALKGWEDEVNFSLIMEPRFHRMVIGKGGENLTKLQNKYDGVRIQFPRSGSTPDDQSVADDASQIGGSRKSRPAQAANVVTVRGPRARAEAVRKELLDLEQFYKDHSQTTSVSVARSQIPSLMGKGGREMELLRADTGANIDVPQMDNGGSDRVEIKLTGSKEQINAAKSELLKKSKTFDDIVERRLIIDKKHHKDLIGAGGANIRKIVTAAGGPENNARAVQFPKGDGPDSNEVVVRGPKEVVDKICAALEALATTKDNEITEVVDVPAERHFQLIGTGGDIRKRLETEFGVSINVPRRGSGETGVKITGPASEVSKAISHISNVTKPKPEARVDIPKSLHHTVSNNGRLFANLRNQGIIVVHDGVRAPPKPESGASTPRTNGNAPLITDDPADSFSWSMITTGPLAGDEDMIPWILRGQSEENVAAARKKVEEALEKASKPSTTGYLILSDPKLHRHVVGKGGSKVGEIRDKTGCIIQIPQNKPGNASEAITIIGDREACEEAKEMILEAVEEGQNRS